MGGGDLARAVPPVARLRSHRRRPGRRVMASVEVFGRASQWTVIDGTGGGAPSGPLHWGDDEMFRLLFHRHPHPMWVYDEETRACIDVNQAAQDRYGYTHDEIMALPLPQFRTPTTDGEVLMRHRTKWGHPLRAQVALRRIQVSGRRYLLIVARDVTSRIEAAEARQAQEARFRALVQRSTDIALIVGTDRIIAYASPALEPVTGHCPEDIVGLPAAELVHPDDRQLVEDTFARHIVGSPGASARLELRVRHADGTWHWVEEVATNLCHDEAIGGYVLNIRDITERRAAEEAQSRQLEASRVFQHTLDASVDAFIGVDRDGVVEDWNGAAERLFGWTNGEAVGRAIEDLIVVPEMRAANRAGVLRARVMILPGGKAVGPLEMTGMTRDGRRIPLEISFTVVEHAGAVCYKAFVRDLTDRKAAEEVLRNRAMYDGLTGLVNGQVLGDEIAGALARSEGGGDAALLVLGIDRFTEINDSLGHAMGDSLLVEVGCRLRDVIGPAGTVARLGGDQFAVLVPSLCGSRALSDLADRTVGLLRSVFTVGEMQVLLGVSIGVVLAPEHGADPTTLLQRADTAMYRAKRGGGGWEMYCAEQDSDEPARTSLAIALAKAVEMGAIDVHYQPQIDLSTGRVVGLEALARWDRPGHGPVSPAEFIPLAESTGLIGPLTDVVLDAVVRQLGCWRRAGGDFGVSVNLSPRLLADPQLAHRIKETMQKAGVAEPDALTIEITESAFAAGPATLRVIDELSALGFRISIDDFGTGYSSMSYLKRIPVHEMKLDRTFVADILESAADLAVVQSLVSVGHARGLTVVAEGVESAAVRDQLARIGCDVAQGYHLCEPAPAEQITSWLKYRTGAGSR